MAQFAHFVIFLVCIAVAIPVGGLVYLLEAITGHNPLSGPGVQR